VGASGGLEVTMWPELRTASGRRYTVFLLEAVAACKEGEEGGEPGSMSAYFAFGEREQGTEADGNV
jgi:hypothetical protein